MNNGVRRRVLSAICCIAMFPSLTSCFFGDPDYAISPTTISRAGDALLVSVCADVRFTDVSVEARKFPNNWKEVYVATGDAELKAGDIFSSQGTIPGLNASVAVLPDFTAMGQIMVVLSDSRTKSPVSSAAFDVPESGVPEGKWLHWDGTITVNACPG